MAIGSGVAVGAELCGAHEEGVGWVGGRCPPCVGAACDAEGLGAALALATKWGWGVNLHATDPRGRSFPGKIETPAEDLIGLTRAWPGLRFTLAHWAGGFDVRDLSNVWVDTAAAPLMYGEEAWAMRGVSVRAERVLFGSDYPLRLARGLDAAAGWAEFAARARENGLGGTG